MGMILSAETQTWPSTMGIHYGAYSATGKNTLMCKAEQNSCHFKKGLHDEAEEREGCTLGSSETNSSRGDTWTTVLANAWAALEDPVTGTGNYVMAVRWCENPAVGGKELARAIETRYHQLSCSPSEHPHDRINGPQEASSHSLPWAHSEHAVGVSWIAAVEDWQSITLAGPP